MCTEKGLEHFHVLSEKRIKASEPLFFFILLFLPYLSSSFKNCYYCCCCYTQGLITKPKLALVSKARR